MPYSPTRTLPVLLPHLNDFRDRIAARDADWRAGAVVYQVFVDRFAPSENLHAKTGLYPAPKRLREWHETPAKGHFVESAGVWSHEIDFWGGDLQSVRARLGHLEAIRADVLYLNPIHLAYTNHKYDSADYLEISPEYGTRADLRMLVGDAHARGMKVVLDGVFNHCGKTMPEFLAAKAGDAAKGKTLVALCQACHMINGQGGLIGPNLSGAGAMGMEAVIRNIIEPNAAIEAAYRIFQVKLKSGEVIEAFYVSEDAAAYVIRQAGGADRRVPKAEVASAKYLRRSLMPEGLLDGFTDEQVTDLFAYLKTLK
jgi:putative heme-binding domain-containing protein